MEAPSLTLPFSGEVASPLPIHHNGQTSMPRRSEWLLIVFFVYAAILSGFLPVSSNVRWATCALNLTIVANYALLAYADSPRPGKLLGAMRDWFPLVLTLLCYREMGWFATAQHTYELERQWILWDRWLLSDWSARAAIERLGPAIPSLLEIAYSLVYAIAPFGVTMLYVYQRRERADRFWVYFLLGLLLSYGQFPFWPSEPPRTVFPGQDLPGFETIFRRFNYFLVGNYGIHTSVFPSAHVSGAFAAAFGMWRALPERPWVARALLILAILIAIATIYGRYHYLADAVAGIAIGVIALALGLAWDHAEARSALRSRG